MVASKKKVERRVIGPDWMVLKGLTRFEPFERIAQCKTLFEADIDFALKSGGPLVKKILLELKPILDGTQWQDAGGKEMAPMINTAVVQPGYREGKTWHVPFKKLTDPKSDLEKENIERVQSIFVFIIPEPQTAEEHIVARLNVDDISVNIKQSEDPKIPTPKAEDTFAEIMESEEGRSMLRILNVNSGQCVTVFRTSVFETLAPKEDKGMLMIHLRYSAMEPKNKLITGPARVRNHVAKYW